MFFFLAYFTLNNWLQFHPSHQNLFKCILFNGWVILHCVYVPQLSSPFVCWWTSRLPPCPGYYKQCYPRSQREESHLWQDHEEGSLTKRKDVIKLQGFPLEFPEHPPPKKIRICLLFHPSDILWKKSNQGFSLLHLKGMFQLNPSDSSLACLTGSPRPLTACELLAAPNFKRHKA